MIVASFHINIVNVVIRYFKHTFLVLQPSTKYNINISVIWNIQNIYCFYLLSSETSWRTLEFWSCGWKTLKCIIWRLPKIYTSSVTKFNEFATHFVHVGPRHGCHTWPSQREPTNSRASTMEEATHSWSPTTKPQKYLSRDLPFLVNFGFLQLWIFEIRITCSRNFSV